MAETMKVRTLKFHIIPKEICSYHVTYKDYVTILAWAKFKIYEKYIFLFAYQLLER